MDVVSGADQDASPNVRPSGPALDRRRAWLRPGGPGGLWQVGSIALPLIVSTSTWSIMIFVDRTFLMWSSRAEMAAALPAGMIAWTSMSFFVGLGSYTNTFVAQYAGAGRPQRILDSVVHGLYLSLAAIPFMAVLIVITPWLFRHADHGPEVLGHEIVYFRILAALAIFDIATHTISCYWTGRGKTWPVMIVSLIACAANVPLDYALIFGWGPIPKLGIAGAAIATGGCVVIRLVLFSAWLAWDYYKAPAVSWIKALKFDRELTGRMLWYGAPAGIGFVFEGAAMSLLVLALGRYGTDRLAASGLAMSINAIAFTPLIGLSIAASTLVGQYLARGRVELAKRALWSAVIWGTGASAVFGLLCVVMPDLMMALQRAGADETDYEAVRPTAVIILQFVAVYCVFDALQILFAGALKGAGDTRFVLVASVVISLSGVGLGYVGSGWLAHFWPGMEFWFWYVILTGWLVVLALVFGARFLSGAWTKYRVIESPPLPEGMSASDERPRTDAAPSDADATTSPSSGERPRSLDQAVEPRSTRSMATTRPHRPDDDHTPSAV